MSSNYPTRGETHIHANCIVIGNQGVLICGESGAGKTSLMLELIERARINDEYAVMISDDQSIIINSNDRLIARCPGSIQGKAEIRGHGIINLPYLASCIVGFMVEIVPIQNLERLPGKKYKSLAGVEIPHIYVPQYSHLQSISIIKAALSG